eukprot:SAG11_NODE_9449_length_910_cov_1.583231_1_plen_177_part_10
MHVIILLVTLVISTHGFCSVGVLLVLWFNHGFFTLTPWFCPYPEAVKEALNAKDNAGRTVLDHAVLKGSDATVATLVREKFSPEVLSMDALQHARELACQNDHSSSNMLLQLEIWRRTSDEEKKQQRESASDEKKKQQRESADDSQPMTLSFVQSMTIWDDVGRLNGWTAQENGVAV